MLTRREEWNFILLIYVARSSILCRLLVFPTTLCENMNCDLKKHLQINPIETLRIVSIKQSLFDRCIERTGQHVGSGGASMFNWILNYCPGRAAGGVMVTCRNNWEVGSKIPALNRLKYENFNLPDCLTVGVQSEISSHFSGNNSSTLDYSPWQLVWGEADFWLAETTQELRIKYCH